MGIKKDIHFEVSERKILLRVFDILSVFLGLILLEFFFNYDYLLLDSQNSGYLLVLAFYLTIMGTVFEMYDLQKASKLDVTFRNIVLTASTTILFYFLTPIITPFLPERRLQIVYFYLAIVVMLFLWRLAYVAFISSPRFNKRVLLVGETSYVESIVDSLHVSDPNYRIIGF
ncbi:MAG TPA: sugar transferase, partial [Aquaticitalea sp.]|nr:sugar transferase [Aquaticitalea sp.]